MPKAGLFAGEVTPAAPADGAITTKFKGYQWMEYGNVVAELGLCNEVFGITALTPDLHVAGVVAGVWDKGIIQGTGTIIDDRVDSVYARDINYEYKIIPGNELVEVYYTDCQWYAYSGGLLQDWMASGTYDYTDVEWTKLNSATAVLDTVGLDPNEINYSSTLTDPSATKVSSAWKRSTASSVIGTDTLVAVGYFRKDLTSTNYSMISIEHMVSGADITLAKFHQATGEIELLSSTTGVDGAVDIIDAGNWWEVYIQTRANGVDGANNLLNTGKFSHYPAYQTDGGLEADVTLTGNLRMGDSSVHYPATIGTVRGGVTLPKSIGAPSAVIDQSNIYIDIANHSNTSGGYYIEWRPMYSDSEITRDVEILSLSTSANLLYYDWSTKLLTATDGTNTATVPITVIAKQKYRCAVIFGNGLRVGVDSEWGNEESYDGSFPTGSDFYILRNPEAINYWRELRGYQVTQAAAYTEISALMSGLRPPVFTGNIRTQEWLTTIVNSTNIATFFNAPTGTLTFAVVAGVLPDGMTLNTSSGVISGQPTSATTGTLQISCTNSLGSDVTNTFSWETAAAFDPIGVVDYTLTSAPSASPIVVTLPTVSVGNTLVVAIYHDAKTGIDPMFTTYTSGWTKLYDYGNTAQGKVGIFAKVSDGTETTFQTTTESTNGSAVIAFNIKGTLDYHNSIEKLTASTTILVPNISTKADSYALALFGSDTDTATSSIDNGFTKIDQAGAGAGETVLAFAEKDYASAGLTGTTTATFSVNAGVMSAMLTFS